MPDELESLRIDHWERLRKSEGKEVYPLDEAFLQAMETGHPPAGGIALGVDRLLMLLTDAKTLDEVLPFRD